MILYPYQDAWVADKSQQKLCIKSRRIGMSFVEGFAEIYKLLDKKQNAIILSAGERQAKAFIADCVAPHLHAIGMIAEYTTGLVPETSFYQQEVRLENGSKIFALPGNPLTVRSYEGHLTIDEAAFIPDFEEIYQAAGPSITRGYDVCLISTTNGKQGKFYEICKDAGLDGTPPKPNNKRSVHRITIYDAIAQGCKDRFGRPLNVDAIRETCISEDMWNQEYMCLFLSTASQWIPPELFSSCVDDKTTTGYPSLNCKDLFAGWDVARNKDFSVIWFAEEVNGSTFTRGVIEMKDVPTPDQVAEVRALMPRIRRLVIDKSSMGLPIFEQLNKEYGSKVEGVLFTLPAKEALATHAKMRMEAHKSWIPDTDMIRHSFSAVKKTVTSTGQARFDAEHDDKYGHSDHWWAYALCENAAYRPGDSMLPWMERKIAAGKEKEKEL